MLARQGWSDRMVDLFCTVNGAPRQAKGSTGSAVTGPKESEMVPRLFSVFIGARVNWLLAKKITNARI